MTTTDDTTPLDTPTVSAPQPEPELVTEWYRPSLPPQDTTPHPLWGQLPGSTVHVVHVLQAEPATAQTAPGGLFHRSAIPAVAKWCAVTGTAAFAHVTAWGSAAATWAHLVLWCDAPAHGGLPVAAVVTGAGLLVSWWIDPGQLLKGRHPAHTFTLHAKHYTARVVRWAVILGSAAVPAVALGFIHATTGAH